MKATFIKYTCIYLIAQRGKYEGNAIDRSGQRRTQIFVEFVVLALSAAVFVVGGIAVTMNAHGQISAAMKLPMECYYACIPIGGALMILYSLNNLYHLFRDKDKEVA